MEKIFSQQRMKEAIKAAAQLGILQDWIRDYLSRSNDDSSKNVFYWISLFNYEFGDFCRHIVYKIAYNRWNKDMIEEAVGEAFLAFVIIVEKSGIDLFEGVKKAMDKYNEQEWKRKK